MSRQTYSRLVIPRRASDETVLGIVSLYSPLGFVEEGADLVACFREAEAARLASDALSAAEVSSELIADLPEGDPLEAFRATSRPFAVGGRFWVDPGDPSDTRAPGDRIALRLPASTAFGTGGHESTRLALRALEEDPPAGVDVLDVGTGSSVLALASAALGARRVVGLDIDAQAVFVARENLRRHPFGFRVSLLAGPVDAVRGLFALVVANMLPDELLALRAAILPRIAPSGRLILSGIPVADEKRTLAPFRSRRLRLAGRFTEGEWVCVLLAPAS